MPFIVFGNGPNIFMAMNSNKILAGKSSKCRVGILNDRVHANSRQSVVEFCTVLAMSGQYTLRLMI